MAQLEETVASDVIGGFSDGELAAIGTVAADRPELDRWRAQSWVDAG